MRFSILLRRIHLYLALFLAPWILMYAASTFVMNHRTFFRGPQPLPAPAFEKERELTYNGEIGDGATPRQAAMQILSAIDLDGAHGVNRAADGRLTINRQDPVHPRRITYHPASKQIVVEKMVYDTPSFLERMHRRRGYQQEYAVDDVWAVTVDLVIAAIVFWALSGLWMWWELKPSRRLGALALAGGVGLFALFLRVL